MEKGLPVNATSREYCCFPTEQLQPHHGKTHAQLSINGHTRNLYSEAQGQGTGKEQKKDNTQNLMYVQPHLGCPS